MNIDSTFMIEQTLDEAEYCISEAFKVGDRFVNDIPYFYHPDDENCERDKYHITSNLNYAWLIILTILEKYDHPTLLLEAKKEYVEYLKQPLMSKMGIEEPYLYWINPVQRYVNFLRSFYVKKDPKELSSNQERAIQIIKKSEKFVSNRDIFGFVPCSEKEVHDRIEELLSCAFRDVKRKPIITKAIKNFEPDTSISSIDLLIEFKFVDSSEQCKRVVDEIIADIGGYQSPKKEMILFVIYETRRYFRSDDWENAINEANPPSPVKHVLLKGIEVSQIDIDLKKEYEIRLNSFKKRPKKKSETSQGASKEGRSKAGN